MSEKIKLGLTRNRLFEFDNCVFFSGELQENLDLDECEKALKMLFLKEPILTCKVEIANDGDAFLVTNAVEPVLEILNGDADAIIEQKRKQGLGFEECLFSFAVINGSTLAIFAHTVVADGRTLAYLAKEFKRFYKKESFSVEPSEIMVLSESAQLLSNVFSVVIDRIASGLEVGWQKKIQNFSFVDYKKARDKYLAGKPSVERLAAKLDETAYNNLKTFSEKTATDVSSLVAFAFYESLIQSLSGKRKYGKLNIQANERVFFDDFEKMKAGPFNGVVAVALKEGKDNKPLCEKAVLFHKEIYKKITTAFSVFYNEVLFMRLSGSFCDSQYMYCAGLFKHKYSKRLALTYGCANQVAGEFCSFNFNQKYWDKLSCFERIKISEPLKMRSSSLVTFKEDAFGCEFVFEYKTDKIPQNIAENVFNKAVEILKNLQ